MENTNTNINAITPVHKMVCAICGEEINGQYVKEYCQSPSLHKWLKENISLYDYRELKKLVLSRDNIIYVCEDCSYQNTKKKINYSALHLPKSRLRRMSELYAKIKPYSDLYRDMKVRVILRQDHKCYQCGCKIKENGCVLRRIDTTEARTEENGCLVCYSCDDNYTNFRHVQKNESESGEN